MTAAPAHGPAPVGARPPALAAAGGGPLSDPSRAGTSADPALLTLLARLSERFYQVVPPTLRCHCLLSSLVNQQVLHAWGIDAERVPCQIVHAGPSRNIVSGFTGGVDDPERWDGHVVCVAEGFVLDAATHAFEERFGVWSPWFVTVPRMQGVRSHLIARQDLATGATLWWLEPPAGADTRLPAQSQALADSLSQRLLRALKAG